MDTRHELDNEPIQGLPSEPSQAEQSQEAETTTGTLTPPPVGNVPVEQPPPTGSLWTVVLLYGAVFGAMWFFLIRPQRKRERQMKELQSTITVGDSVVTSTGLFGKIAEVGHDCFIVEFGTNKGVRIPVLKGDVVGVREPIITPPPKAE